MGLALADRANHVWRDGGIRCRGRGFGINGSSAAGGQGSVRPGPGLGRISGHAAAIQGVKMRGHLGLIQGHGFHAARLA